MARRLRPEPLTEEAWEPFGWLPPDDVDPRERTNRLVFEWNDPHVNIIRHALEELRIDSEGLWCEELFRHRTHTQALMALDTPTVIAVAPWSTSGREPAPPPASGDSVSEHDSANLVASVRAFVLEPLRALVLHRGTWHWGPYPLEAPSVRLFNVQEYRYAEDNDRADLAAVGGSILVERPSGPFPG